MDQPTKYEFDINADLRISAVKFQSFRINFKSGNLCIFRIKDIIDPIQFHMKYSKCPLENEGSTCDDHETAKFDNICEVLSAKNTVWSQLFTIIKPRLVCPIKKVRSRSTLTHFSVSK